MNPRFHSQIYRMLWRIWPKKLEVIEGETITYVVLPTWLLRGCSRSREALVDGMGLARKSDEIKMIFVSKREFKNRQHALYTIYHEYIELSFGLGQLQALPNWKDRIESAVNSLGDDDARVLGSRINQVATEGIQAPGHLAAIILEAAFARKQMNEDEWRVYFNDILQNRL